jgi:hypothetical protein
VILDTALYEAGTSELIRPANLTANLRKVPTAFKVYTGACCFFSGEPAGVLLCRERCLVLQTQQ